MTNSEDLLDRITAIYQTTRDSNFGDICHRITQTANQHGEWHGDHAANWQLDQPNMIGVAVRHLQRNGILETTGEHRPGTTPGSHGRRSYVYRLTVLGKRAITTWPQREPTPQRTQMVKTAWPTTTPTQQTLDLTGSFV